MLKVIAQNLVRGADFSLIETAKASGIDPYKYLVYIFKTAPTLSTTDENWANKLLPENFKTAY